MFKLHLLYVQQQRESCSWLLCYILYLHMFNIFSYTIKTGSVHAPWFSKPLWQNYLEHISLQMNVAQIETISEIITKTPFASRQDILLNFQQGG